MTAFAAPSFFRTWQFQVSVAIPAQGSVALTSARGLRMAKDAMLGTGAWTDAAGGAVASSGDWTMDHSCDAVTAGTPGDGVDRLTADANFTFRNASFPGTHSWMVLKQTGMSATHYLCIACFGVAFQDGYTCTMAWSKTPFSGGTTNARPTSTGESWRLATWGGPSANVGSRMHVMKAADGSATRIVFARNNFACGMWAFEDLVYAPPGVVNPAIAAFVGDSTGAPGASNLVQTWWSNATNATPAMLQVNDKPALGLFMPMYYGASSCITTPTVANDMEGKWPAFPVAIHTRQSQVMNSATPIHRARGDQGFLRDLWWVQSQLGEADYHPSGGGRNIIILGDFALPWNTTAAVMA